MADERDPHRVERLLPAQRRAVEAPGDVAVVAGAGTGKTHMLAHRFLKHVRDGLDPLEIVAVTFTERAAAELRARIRRLLVAEMTGSPAALTVEAAQIGTVHALAQRICREFPDEADVPPDFAILDQLEGAVWSTERLDRAMALVPPALFAAVPYQYVRTGLGVLLADPLTAESALALGSDTWPGLVAAARAAARTALTSTRGWLHAARRLRSCAGAEGDRRETARRVAVAALDDLAAGSWELGLEALAGLSLVGGSRTSFAPGEFDAVGEAIRHVREETRRARDRGLVELSLGAVDERWAAALPVLTSAFHAVRLRLDEEKRARRVLDFADLEVHALAALEHAAVVDHYAARWRALLVDEFQDTNAVQERLLERLAGGMTVTIVGDEKQSIYAFRGAQAAVFERARRRVLDRGGDEVELGQSFRAHSALVTAVNAVFAPLLGPAHQDLEAVRATGAAAGPFVRVLLVGSGGAKAERQLAEARALAGAIRDLVESGVHVHDRDSGGTRPVRYGDVAVLARGWRALGVYGEVLPALGVPAVHTGGGDLLATREARDGVALLRALVEPDDDVALVALLRGPYFAVDDVTLTGLGRFRRGLEGPGTGGKRGTGRDGPDRASYWRALCALPDPAPALARARAVVSELLAARGAVPATGPSRLLAMADALTGYSAVLAGLPGGRRRLADHGGFVRLVRQLEEGSDDVFGVWRRLRSLLAAGVDVTRPTLAADGAVTLMTIHGSKGLEWPVVVVADLERRERTTREPVLVDASLGVAFRLEDDDGQVDEPAIYRIVHAAAAEREAAEELRLLYVALTRARDVLLLSAAGERGGALDALAPGLDAAGIAAEVVAMEAGAATYPSGRPTAPTASDELQPSIDLTLVGTVAGREESGARALPGPAGWSGAHDMVALLDDAWTGLAAALDEAGAAPPALDLAGRWLVGGSLRQPLYVLLGWRTPGGLAVLLPRGVVGADGEGVDLGPVTIARRPDASEGESSRAVALCVDPLAAEAPGDVLAWLEAVVSAACGSSDG